MKKYISVFLAIIMMIGVCTAVPLTANAVYINYENRKNDNFEYVFFKDEGCIGVYSYTGKESEVVIPETIDGYPVTKIGAPMFEGCDFVTKISVPDTITEVGEDTFADTAMYKDEKNWVGGAFYIGSLLIAVDEDFEGEFNVKKGTTVIAHYAFSGCEKITKVTVPGTVKHIPESGFYKCKSLETAVFEEGVENIDELVFGRCEKLKNIKLPKTINRVGYKAFNNSAFYNNIYNWENGALYYNHILIEVDHECEGVFTVKDGTTVLADYAFMEANVEKINLPKGIKVLPYALFNNCLWINEFNMNDDLEIIGSYSMPDIDEITLPESVKKIDYRGFEGNHASKITLPENLEEIGVEAFLSCINLKEITIPKNVKKIGYEALGYRLAGLGPDGYLTEKTEGGIVIKGYPGTVAETYAKENEFEFVDLTKEPVTEPTTEPTTVAPSTEPVVIQKKANTLNVTAKTKIVKAKKLKSKKQTVNSLTVKNAQGKVTFKLVKKGTSSKIYKKLSVNTKGKLTLKKGKYKKGTYKVKLKVTAAGNSNYKSATKTVSFKLKIV